ncbi:MAG: arsenic efflux protein [Lachnospiraceae bacterium]|nr:arsenic efflux protein [Lachnospiraceae bacterium]
MLHELLHIFMHTIEDNIFLILFLFLTYLIMEYLEHKAGGHANELIKKAGSAGPIIGAVVGIVPQCGFAAAAANLYAGRVISMGTLIAIFLATSDEVLPILLAHPGSISLIFVIFGLKVVVGAVCGLVIDKVLPAKEEHDHIHELCENEHCHCEKGVFRSALTHTLHIAVFILLISFVLNLVMHTVGEEALGNLVLNRPIIGQIAAAIIGLIPNCASSVVLTQLYVKGAMTFGALMSGLFVNAGIGLLILFRVNHDKKENLRILGLLLGIGIVAGIIIGFFPIFS